MSILSSSRQRPARTFGRPQLAQMDRSGAAACGRLVHLAPARIHQDAGTCRNRRRRLVRGRPHSRAGCSGSTGFPGFRLADVAVES